MPKSGTSFAAASMFALRSASSAASAAAARAYARGLPTRKARSAEVATALQWRRRRLLILRSRRLYRASPAYSERPARAPPSAWLRQRASPALVPMEAMTRATSERRRRGGRGSAAGLPRHLPYTPLYGMGATVYHHARDYVAQVLVYYHRDCYGVATITLLGIAANAPSRPGGIARGTARLGQRKRGSKGRSAAAAADPPPLGLPARGRAPPRPALPRPALLGRGVAGGGASPTIPQAGLPRGGGYGLEVCMYVVR